MRGDFKCSILTGLKLDARLRNYIHHISFDDAVNCSEERYFLPLIPDGMSELVINLGRPYFRAKKQDLTELQEVKTSHFVGFKTANNFVVPAAGANAISIRFKPGCLCFFVEGNLAEFTDKTVDADLVFGKDFKELEAVLAQTSSKQMQVKLIERFLCAKLDVQIKKTELLHHVNAIYYGSKTWKSEKMQSDYKRMERLFKYYLGSTPKNFQQIIQFNYASKLLTEKKFRSLTEVAHEADYYDQAHFIKKFRAYSGLTPKEYAAVDVRLVQFNQQIINNLF